MKLVLIALSLVSLGMAAWAFRERRRSIPLVREQAIRGHVFPQHMLDAVATAYPGLDRKDLQLVARAMREFFIVHARLPGLSIGLPSRTVDALWHEFILDTRAYETFCKRAFGAFFHHIPAERMGGAGKAERSMRRTWRIACREENIDPVHAMRVPLLFAIDTKLGIPDAVPYTADSFKSETRKDGCGGGCGGSDGGGDSSCCGSCGGGCGGD